MPNSHTSHGSKRIALGLALGLMSVTTPALAQDTSPLRIAQASRVVYDTGMASRDPLLVLAAAKMRMGLGLNPSDRMAEGGEKGDKALDAGAMLAMARELATGDDLILGLIEDTEAESGRGVTNGPVYNIARLGAKGQDKYPAVPFDGGKYAEIYVEATGPNDMNLHIYDDKNRLVCSDTDSSVIAYCGWTPASTGSFSIKITNASNAAAEYSMITN